MLNIINEIHEQQRQPLTPWELPSLLTSVHTYRRSRRKAGRERKHFPAILGFVYRNRFAVASQIQRRFSDVLRSDRTARRHLEELESLGYLAAAPARGVSPLFPKVYYVDRPRRPKTSRVSCRPREVVARRPRRPPGPQHPRGVLC